MRKRNRTIDACMNAVFIVLLGLLLSLPVQAQSDLVKNSQMVRRTFAEYDEEILYFGKRNQYFTVRTLLKNGSLFRVDSYQVLPQTLPNGFPLDSLSRIFRFGPTKIMYLTGKPYITCEYKDDVLHGPFMVFYEDGSIKRKEYYRNGRMTQSACFTADGTKEACTPFYQSAQFLGKPTELSTYMKQKLGPLVDGERIRRVTATLAINEIGQVTGIGVLLNTNVSENAKMPEAVTYVQQVIRNMPEWTPEKLNWKPAINDGKATASTCVLTVFRVYGSLQYNMFYRL
ncbi:hypothetical protein [Spirosoma sp.]|uniref:toxin-antitoxin system YwqK family antitoxin n=1 Tax=Spirosoma sp. TaxID=1899569 RepID=UPI00260FF503|nr:hypothetical protein [Spirosoma sp.]MCX6216435.1 hypothetical protein [Spirosoma sp.]